MVSASLPRLTASKAPSLKDSVLQKAQRAFLNPHEPADLGRFLEVEITESIFVEIHWIEILNALKEMKVQIAIDDFGTGYSSLSRLKEMSINCLKIDSSFVYGCGIDDHIRDEGIIQAIIAMAHSMNLRVIAEGVETKSQADFLKDNHCEIAQGFFFSRPMCVRQTEIFFQRLAPQTNP